MKRILILIGIGIIIILAGAAFALHIWIGHGVKENINIVQQKYPDTAEDALISYLLDENNAAYDRTHKAIWTLGQVRLEKALPILREYFDILPSVNERDSIGFNKPRTVLPRGFLQVPAADR